nr:four helix bundle protein [Bacteroidota bacterium]
MKTPERKYDLEDRLINFSIAISEIVEILPNTRFGNQIAGQLVRSGTSPALNYGEAMSAESTNDFVHKLKIILKELRESFVCLKIIKRKPLIKPEENIDPTYTENNELIAIFVKSIPTAKTNQIKQK